MELRTWLDLCQVEYADEWHRLPAEDPLPGMLVSIEDVASKDEPPALALRMHTGRAVYGPIAELGIAWGMPLRDWRDHERWDHPWAPKHWNGVELRYAHVLLNGAPIWQVAYAQVDRGAGTSGALPWPSPDSSDGEDPVERVSSWDVSFARLLGELDGYSAFDFDRELAAAKMVEQRGHPLD